jgi:hypothetical protein
MEKRNIIFIDKYPKEYESIQQKEIKDKQDALKIFGNYLISLTNICFEKCIDTTKIQFSNYENNCLDSCHNKFHALYYKTFVKYYNEEKLNIKRAFDYGDKYDILTYLKTKDNKIE